MAFMFYHMSYQEWHARIPKYQIQSAKEEILQGLTCLCNDIICNRYVLICRKKEEDVKDKI